MSLEFCSVRHSQRIKEGYNSAIACRGKNRLVELIASDQWEKAFNYIDRDNAKRWSYGRCTNPSSTVEHAPDMFNTSTAVSCSRTRTTQIDSQILPIHQACSNQYLTLPFIQSLVDAYPRSLSMCDSLTMRTPLHLAIIYGIGEHVVSYLLEKQYSSAKVQDYRGRVPLHYACADGFVGWTMPVVKRLVRRCPETIRATDDTEWTPLHVAAIHSENVDVIELMLSLSPEAVLMTTKNGDTVIDLVEYNISRAKDLILARLVYWDERVRGMPEFLKVVEAYSRNRDDCSLVEDNTFV